MGDARKTELPHSRGKGHFGRPVPDHPVRHAALLHDAFMRKELTGWWAYANGARKAGSGPSGVGWAQVVGGCSGRYRLTAVASVGPNGSAPANGGRWDWGRARSTCGGASGLELADSAGHQPDGLPVWPPLGTEASMALPSGDVKIRDAVLQLIRIPAAKA